MSAATTALYETLARWQRWRHPGQLELRKRLLPPPAGGDGPTDGAAGLDAWLQARLGPRWRAGARVLDVGCGFGASLQRWVAAGGGEGIGVTSSPYQVRIATRAAARAGLAARLRFAAGDFASLPAGPFDVVLAIEALGHAAELGVTLQAIRAALTPGGTLVWVDDLLREPAAGDDDVRELAACWSSPLLRDDAEVAAALRTAGLAPVAAADLTPQVPLVPMAANRRRARRLRRLGAWLPLPPVRRLAAAFRGGLALERLYARGLACYRVLMAARPPEDA